MIRLRLSEGGYQKAAVFYLALGALPSTNCLSYAARAFSSNLAIRHALVLESGRHSSIRTRSPSPHSFFSSWAWYFFERVRIFPYIGWVTRRSTSTVTVLSILSLTTRPVSVRVVLLSVILPLPSLSGWCARARCRGALS